MQLLANVRRKFKKFANQTNKRTNKHWDIVLGHIFNIPCLSETSRKNKQYKKTLMS